MIDIQFFTEDSNFVPVEFKITLSKIDHFWLTFMDCRSVPRRVQRVSYECSSKNHLNENLIVFTTIQIQDFDVLTKISAIQYKTLCTSVK